MKSIYLLDPEITKMQARVCIGKRIPHLILVYDLLVIDIKILFLKLSIVLNLNLNSSKSWAKIEYGILVPIQTT